MIKWLNNRNTNANALAKIHATSAVAMEVDFMAFAISYDPTKGYRIWTVDGNPLQAATYWYKLTPNPDWQTSLKEAQKLCRLAALSTYEVVSSQRKPSEFYVFVPSEVHPHSHLEFILDQHRAKVFENDLKKVVPEDASNAGRT